jgi:ABC-2 type transport system permease protein
LKRYLSILSAFLKTSVVADMEFRANLSVKVLTDILWYIAQLSTFEILYVHTDRLGGWQVEQMRVFMTMLFIVDALYMFFFSENLDQLGVKIVKGELDFLLTKPIDSQFMASLHRINTAYFVNILIVSTGFVWALTNLPGGVPWSRLALLLIVIPSGLAVVYFTRLIFAASAMFFGANASIMMVWFQIYRLATRPDVIYPRVIRLVVLTALPMAFVASVPTRLLVDEWAPSLVFASVFVGLVTIWLSRKYWAFAMSRYASASS